MLSSSLVCATPKTNKPAPKGKPEPVQTPKKREKISKRSPKAIGLVALASMIEGKPGLVQKLNDLAAASPGGKLPVPPPKSTASVLKPLPKGTIIDGVDCSGMTADPKKEGIPVFTQVQNRKPLSKEQQAKIDAQIARARSSDDRQKRDAAAAKIIEEQKAIKTDKARVRIQKLKASKNGDTKAMPLTGKKALAAIKQADKVLGAEADEQVRAGRSNVVKPPKAKKPLKAKAAKPQKPAKAKAPAKAQRKAPVRPKAEGPSGMAAEIGLLASRAKGASRAELIELSGWAAQAWKWYFVNSKGNGFCQKWGYKLEVIEGKDGETRYKITKKS